MPAPNTTTPYITTHIQPTRSYPTYQFYSITTSSAPVSDTFRICILETFRWLRNRLDNFSALPPVLTTPDPESYSAFPESSLASFSVNISCSIDCIYLKGDDLWTITISENDMGVNVGSDDERPAVQGRRFTTEISYRKHPDFVEAGVRTICTEPVNTNADCEVFRPTFIKMLSQNPKVCFRNSFNIDGEPVKISSKSDADNFCEIISSGKCDMPFVLVCQPEKLKKVTKASDVFENAAAKSMSSSLGVSSSFPASALSVTSDPKNDLLSGFSVKVEKKEKEKKKKDEKRKGIAVDIPKPKQNVKKKEIKDQYEYTEQPTIDYVSLADSLKCYGFTVYIPEQFLDQINKKLDLRLDPGDVVVMMHGMISETVKYETFSSDPDTLRKRLKYEVRLMLKGASFTFGSLIFGTDARIREMSVRKNENLTLEEQITLLNQHNSALEEKIKELQNNDAGMRMNAEELRTVNKKLEAETKELEKTEKYLAEMKQELETIKSSYKKASAVMDFYRQKAEAAGRFPNEIESVCEWIEKNFSDKIIVTSRARNELKKYSGSLDVVDLCDGIYYLSGYSMYRLGQISEEILYLYGEANTWDVQGCGKESLRIYEDDYSVVYNGKKYTLDLHIKNGVNSRQLIRIYFCWAENLKKVLIGSMPEHLDAVR